MTDTLRPDESASTTTAPTHSSPQLPAARRVLLSLVLLAGGLGVLLPVLPSVPFVVVLVVAALPLVNARPSVWVGLAVALPWTSRLVTTTGLAPRVLDFLDFPLVLIAFVVAAVQFLGARRALPSHHVQICRYVAVVAMVITISWAFQDYYEPARLVAGIVLALEPFLLLAAVLLMPFTTKEQHTLLLLLLSLLAAQVIFSTIQIVLLGNTIDDVKGTLLETGAGHHVSAGGLVLGFFLLVGLRARVPVIAAFGALSVGVMLIADAKQVLFVVPLAAIVLGATVGRRRSFLSMIGGLIVGSMIAGVAVYAILSYQASETAFDFVDETATEDIGKTAVIRAIWTDLTASPDRLIFGLGPGESVSRFAFLTTGALIKQGSPVATLGLHISRGADKYNDIAFAGRSYNQSSFTSAQSSALGIVGDYGLAGTVAFILLIIAIVRGLLKAPNRGLRSAALASWTLLLPLAAVFDWLEQPPFTLAVVMITGLALRAPREGFDLPRAIFTRRVVIEPVDDSAGRAESSTARSSRQSD